MLLDHTGEKPPVLFSEDGLIAFVFTASLPSFFGATESTVFVASAKDTNICSCKALSLGILRITILPKMIINRTLLFSN